MPKVNTQEKTYKVWKEVNPLLATLYTLWGVVIGVIFLGIVPWFLIALLNNYLIGASYESLGLRLVVWAPLSIVTLINEMKMIHWYKDEFRKHYKKSSKHYKKNFYQMVKLLNRYPINIDSERYKMSSLILYPDHIQLYSYPKGNDEWYYFSGLSTLMYRIFIRAKEKEYKEDLI